MNWLVTVSSEKSAGPYLEWLRAGGVHGVAVSPDNSLPASAGFDALLLVGGGDVAPWRYGANPEPETANVNEPRDEMETDLIRSFMAAGKPVFGICRGIQILNVALGGGLIQHIPRRLADNAPLEIHTPGATTPVFHGVRIGTGTSLGDAIAGAATVNSFHHQAIDPVRLAPGLKTVCTSPSGIIEGVESTVPARKLSAVQWHPERLPSDHPASRDLLQFWVEITTTESE